MYKLLKTSHPGEIRTHDLLFRCPMFLPTPPHLLRSHILVKEISEQVVNEQKVVLRFFPNSKFSTVQQNVEFIGLLFLVLHN
jgi:hypothetical protein